MFCSLHRLAAMRRRDSAHIFPGIKIHRPTDLQTHRSIKPHPQVHSHTQRPIDPWTPVDSTCSHIQRPRDHGSRSTHPQTRHPQLPLSPQPSPGLLGGTRVEGPRQERILGMCGKEMFCRKNRREGRGQKGAEAGREDKKGRGEEEGRERREEEGPAARGVPAEPCTQPGIPFPDIGFEHPEPGALRGDRGNQSPTRACFITLDSAQKLLGVEPLQGGEGTECCPETDPPGRAEAQGSPT